MRILLPLFFVLFAGCQTKPVPVRAAPLPPAEPMAVSHSRLTPEIGHYTLGAYVDADNDLIRHEAHAIQRVEREPRWDLRPAPLPLRETREDHIPATPVVVVEPPECTTVPHAPFVLPPAMPPTPQPAAIVTVVAPPPAPPPTSVTVATLPAAEPALTPNAEGVLDLTAVPDGTEPSPFTVRSVGTEGTREISLQLAGVIGGAFPCALVNGRPLQAGDTTESLFVVRIETDSVLLRHEDRLIRLSVSAKPARLRIAL